MKFYILLFTFITSQCVAQVFRSHPTASAINQFNFKFNALFESSEDYVYSLFSISTALSMLYTGSTGQTKKEFVELFNFPNDINKSTDNFATLLNATNSTTFKSKNSFWPDSNRVQMLKPYLTNLKEGFGIELNYLNFNKIAESVDRINKWAYQGNCKTR